MRERLDRFGITFFDLLIMSMGAILYQPLASPYGAYKGRWITAVDQSSDAAFHWFADHNRVIRVNDYCIKKLADSKKIVMIQAHRRASVIPCLGEKKSAAIFATFLADDISFLCCESLDVVEPPKLLKRRETNLAVGAYGTAATCTAVVM